MGGKKKGKGERGEGKIFEWAGGHSADTCTITQSDRYYVLEMNPMPVVVGF